ncbi:MAG: hypothetical protein Kow0075_08130 [Salibacteraceae bacterium]
MAFFVACAIAFLPALGQDDDKTGWFGSINAGFGMPYGGLGGNLEIGTGHYSVFAGWGYAPASADLNRSIPSSVNYTVGVRYYFDVGSEYFFPRIGLAAGWVTNYYHQAIGNQPYDSHVNGISGHIGVQVYSTEGVVFSFDASMSSNVVIFKSSSHPYFYPFYIRPSVGIGFDLVRIFTSKSERSPVRNKAINPLG